MLIIQCRAGNDNSMNYLLDQIENTPLGKMKAKHLLNRALFGPRREEINLFSTYTITEALDILLANEEDPGPPLHVFGDDPNVPFGETWVDAALDGDVRAKRKKSLRSWWMGLCIDQSPSLREKMVLFWHNHFVTETNVVNIPAYLYQYNAILRAHSTGNFRTMAELLTINTAMLRYLDGVKNTASSPNENYARELFELFSIGKGPLIEEGNYTYYTEEDVQEAARVLTGWKVDKDTLSSYYNDSAHDKGNKTFSDYYGNHVISDGGENEYKELISMIFASKQTAIYIVQKLYRWFVYYQINEEVMNGIILPLADILYDQDYDVKSVLQVLLSSEHFFDPDLRGAYLKNPIEFVAGSARRLELDLGEDLATQYEFQNLLYLLSSYQEMDLGSPPDVAGWPAYYLEPQFNRLWINAATLPQRSEFCQKILRSGYYRNGEKLVADLIFLAEQTSVPSDASVLINEFADLLLPVELSPEQEEEFTEALIPGLPGFEWTLEWNEYKNDPGNETKRNAVEQSLTNMVEAMMSLPEYHLI